MDYMDNYEDIGREQLIDALKALDRTLDDINKRNINKRDITDDIIDNMDRNISLN